ncbi:MAG: mechanosensitive ion channel [Flavobacteriales bacterium]|nr:mechanosensitive ion channel [Flavobacteriales bacterium]
MDGLWLRFAHFLVWVLAILLLVMLLRRGMNKVLADNAIRYRVRKIVGLAGYALIFLVAIITFTGEMKYFSLAIGLISAGLAFALQEVILSVAGWVTIYGAGLYKPGDRIEIYNVKGDVIDIGITKTTLMEIGEWVKSDNYNGRIVQISNAFVFKGPVRNYTSDFPFLWDEITLPIRYGSDLKLTQQIIADAAQASLMDYAEFAKEHWKKMVKKYLIEDANVEPSISMKLTDNWIEFTLRFVVDSKKRRMTKNTLHKDILEAIEKTEGKVSLASATYEVVGLPEVRVNLAGKG